MSDIVHVTAKLAGMRKPQDFLVYPREKSKPGLITVQAKTVIGQFDSKTGKGIINWRGSHGKYFLHLMKTLGAENYTFPRDFVLKCQEMRPNPGDEIGPGVVVGPEAPKPTVEG